MPADEFIPLTRGAAQAIWRIRESVSELETLVGPERCQDPRYRAIRHWGRRRTWLAGRLAVAYLLQQLGMPTLRLLTDQASGRPYIQNDVGWISISHTQHIALAAFSILGPIGVDIEVPTSRLHRVRSRFLHPHDWSTPHTPACLCMLWCIKEAVYKAAHHPTLALKQIRVETLRSLGPARWEAMATAPQIKFRVRLRSHTGHFEALAEPLRPS